VCFQFIMESDVQQEQEQRNYTTFGRFYPRLYTVWSLFRTRETSFVYHDKRGFFLLSGQNIGRIRGKRALGRSIGYSEARFFAFSSKSIPKLLLYK
ncbi:MAG: hypothetical protein PUH63_05475, partial [Firmicutes bacterium]|nr:hypothetical protein [Bacillota bacterium]